jgi:protein-tyrosine phosphatase
VCSGNSCRSPLAEGLLRVKLPARLQDEVVVESAGTLGIDGSPAARYSVELVKEKGGDISSHRSQGVTEELMQETDLVLAMAAEHIEYLQEEFPQYRENIFLLKRFGRAAGEANTDDSGDDIFDPVGSSKETYRLCAELIDEELERIMPTLINFIQQQRRRE